METDPKAKATKARLADALDDAGLLELARQASEGRFDDFESESATPIVDLVRCLEAAGRKDLADRARAGEFDGTREEAEAWFEREGRKLLGGGTADALLRKPD